MCMLTDELDSWLLHDDLLYIFTWRREATDDHVRTSGDLCDALRHS